MRIYVVKAGVRTGTPITVLPAGDISSYETMVAGGAGALFGTTFTPAQINASNFGFEDPG